MRVLDPFWFSDLLIRWWSLGNGGSHNLVFAGFRLRKVVTFSSLTPALHRGFSRFRFDQRFYWSRTQLILLLSLWFWIPFLSLGEFSFSGSIYIIKDDRCSCRNLKGWVWLKSIEVFLKRLICQIRPSTGRSWKLFGWTDSPSFMFRRRGAPSCRLSGTEGRDLSRVLTCGHWLLGNRPRGRSLKVSSPTVFLLGLRSRSFYVYRHPV